jgi:acetylornithine/succinyldiaminopimelate/putrescine aminotransferase
MNQRQLFLSHVAQTSPAPLALEITHSKGIYLIDKDGKKYIDAIAGISVSNLGHRHKAVTKAVKRQTKQYLHTIVYGEFVLSPQVELATLLTKHLPSNLESVYFVNSGAEAVEGAMKLAKRYTSRTEIIAAHNAYHGSTQGAASLMSDPTYTQVFRPLLPNIGHITFNNVDDLAKISTRTAAVIVETVQAECGVQLPTNDYLQKLRARCTEVGALLVLDEIQVGFGRTGSLFAFEQYDIAPDILLLAKGMGGGMPIGAFIAAKEVMHTLTNNPVLGHITTFGGHPVCCAASLATLKTLLKKNYIAKVKEKEALFHELLTHPRIQKVRSAGLLIAVELESFEAVLSVIQYGLGEGLITDWFLFNNTCIRIAPPLIIKKKQIRRIVEVILEGLDRVKVC